MTKDPAFLFYSKDFYEGTRTMLPEERACYIDLMIYQHQNGYIPQGDLKRVLLYCNGIKKATLEATLKAKFTLTDKGWVNKKLGEVISEREDYSQKQSVNGQIGQFWKKMKAFLVKKDYEQLRSALYSLPNDEIHKLVKDKEINKENAKAMLKAMLKHLENANAIEDINNNKEEDCKEEKTEKSKTRFIPPSLDEVIHYFSQKGVAPDELSRRAESFLNFYESKNWMVGKNKMSNWRSAASRSLDWEDKRTTTSPQSRKGTSLADMQRILDEVSYNKSTSHGRLLD